MKYAEKLKKGDKVAIVSLSSGMLGEEFCSHNIEIGVKRLKEYGLLPVFMPNARKGITYLKAHPEARARDLKDAFFDDSIRGIICAIGGAETDCGQRTGNRSVQAAGILERFRAAAG